MDFLTGATHLLLSVSILGLWHIWFLGTHSFVSVPCAEMATLPWPCDPRTGSTNVPLESPEVKGSIFLEVEGNPSTPYVVFNSGQMIGKRGIHRN